MAFHCAVARAKIISPYVLILHGVGHAQIMFIGITRWAFAQHIEGVLAGDTIYAHDWKLYTITLGMHQKHAKLVRRIVCIENDTLFKRDFAASGRIHKHTRTGFFCAPLDSHTTNNTNNMRKADTRRGCSASQMPSFMVHVHNEYKTYM